ncbi:hypothetical protein [Phyllobacterium endophyticum]|uniref:hypothetical protein n=1 Tax=Phyllobacterium endophyticum TaxID=1149773 RepID=UPI0011CB534D|nr:hypothetical protein [Phyllobacterium endophyticum]TXR50103.1 hypothetical protein FVA77_06885 [Phyllobacterium endophyticum]
MRSLTEATHVAGRVTWWSRIARAANRGKRAPERVNKEDLSDHMLRDLGVLDGRTVRGEHTGRPDYGDLLNDYQKRSL